MDDDWTFGIFLPSPAHNFEKMFLVGVYPLVLQQAKEVKTALVLHPIGNELLPVL
jgi:hypothetical protein